MNIATGPVGLQRRHGKVIAPHRSTSKALAARCHPFGNEEAATAPPANCPIRQRPLDDLGLKPNSFGLVLAESSTGFLPFLRCCCLKDLPHDSRNCL